jgi:hypothetical protein
VSNDFTPETSIKRLRASTTAAATRDVTPDRSLYMERTGEPSRLSEARWNFKYELDEFWARTIIPDHIEVFGRNADDESDDENDPEN